MNNITKITVNQIIYNLLFLLCFMRKKGVVKNNKGTRARDLIYLNKITNRKRSTRALASVIRKRKICPNPKRSQMEMSFGMIFSIILIIFFLIFAFYGIKKFLDLQKEVQIKSFINDLQNDIDRMQKSFDGSQERSYVVPKKVEKVCFVDENENFKLIGEKYSDNRKLEGINIEKILGNKEEYCIQNTEGKIKLKLEINYGESLVTIK